MKHEQLDRSSEFAAYFLPRQEEPSMLSVEEVNTLLTQHRAEIDHQTRVARWNNRPISYRTRLLSFGGAAAIALAAYLLFFVGTLPRATHLHPDISFHPPLALNEVGSFHDGSIHATEKEVDRQASSIKDKRITPAIDKKGTSETQFAASDDIDLPFCLSIVPYRVDTASISLLIPHQFAVVLNSPVRTISEDRHRVTYKHESDANTDLLGSIYDIGYLTLADPVISAYDTVRSVSERTLASLKIVPNP